MLKYLISVTESTAVLAILLGLLHAFLFSVYGEKARRPMVIGVLAGAALAAVVTLLRQTTKLWDRSGGTGSWNLRTFAVSLAALAVFAVLALLTRKKPGGSLARAVPIAGGVLALTLVFYALPEVMGYPFSFNLNGDSLLSTAFFYRLIGYVLGLALAALIYLGVERSARRAGGAAAWWVLFAALLVNAVQQVLVGLQTLYSRRVVSGHTLFQVIRFSSNHSNLFIYLTMAIALVIPAALWVRSFTVQEPYENPAQHRIIRARRRSARRWSTLAACCFALAVVTLTVLYSIDNRAVELSPVEECEDRGESLYVPLIQVEDGALHRFAYTTPDNITVRFIVIKKPSSSAYGVGLDACDICGETGYYQRGEQVVCKLCDVVMNINTIGFKGGCNPIVIDYSIGDGYIQVPKETLIEHQNEFR